MNGRLARLMPRSIRGQLAVVMVGAFLASAVTAATVFFLTPPPPPPTGPDVVIGELAAAAHMIDGAPDAAARAAVIESLRANVPAITIAAAETESGMPPHGPFADTLARELGPRFKVSMPRDGDGGPSDPERLVVTLPTGMTLVGTLPPRPLPLGAAGGLIRALIFLGLTIGLLSFWAARALAAPLTRFADAAEHFTGEQSGEPLSEEGPIEIARAARALNDMRARIRQLLEERTLMLAAVSHDLRTPVTRLRLRAEQIERPELRRQVLGDLLTMQGLIQSALWFLRGETKSVKQVPIDLSSLVQTVCDGFVDMGRDVSFTGEPHRRVMGDADQLTRAFANLVDNALKFGTAASVRVVAVPPELRVEVADNGPGIPDADKERAMQPFHRGDAARNLDDGNSFGLGLSVACAVARAHGGRLELLDAPGGGLLARLSLPEAPAPTIRPPTAGSAGEISPCG